MKLFSSTSPVAISGQAKMGALIVLSALTATLFASTPASAQPADIATHDSAKSKLPTQSIIPLAAALEGAEAALKACEAGGHRVSVMVVDQSGNEKILLRSDGAGPHTIASSKGKAFTAASLRRSTGELATFIADKPELAELRDMDPRILILAGGLPILVDNEVIGGIGVGGAPSGAIDAQCAQAGVDKILKETN